MESRSLGQNVSGQRGISDPIPLLCDRLTAKQSWGVKRLKRQQTWEKTHPSQAVERWWETVYHLQWIFGSSCDCNLSGLFFLPPWLWQKSSSVYKATKLQLHENSENEKDNCQRCQLILSQDICEWHFVCLGWRVHCPACVTNAHDKNLCTGREVQINFLCPKHDPYMRWPEWLTVWVKIQSFELKTHFV